MFMELSSALLQDHHIFTGTNIGLGSMLYIVE